MDKRKSNKKWGAKQQRRDDIAAGQKQRRLQSCTKKFPLFAILLAKAIPLLLLIVALCKAQQSTADFYEGGDPSAASNSYFWTAGFPGGGYGANSGGGMPLPPNNPFTPQDFGGSSSDGFDMQRQQQMAVAYQVNGNGPSFLARPPASSPLDFQSAYGANNGGGGDGGGGGGGDDEQVAIEDDNGAPTKFPTLIPQQKLATAGMTEPAVMVEDATEPNQQQNWGTMEGGGNGGGGTLMGEMGAKMDGIGVIKDVSMMRSVPEVQPGPMMQIGGGRPSMNTGGFGGGFAQQQQFVGGSNMMGGGGDNLNPFFGPTNDCFGGGNAAAGCAQPPIDTSGSGGGTYLSGDGSGAYQFPLPDDEGQMMGDGAQMMGQQISQMMGGMRSGQFPGNGFAGAQQLPISNGVNGFFPAPPFGMTRQNMGGGGFGMGEGMDGGGMFGGGGNNFGGFGAISENMGGNGENEEDEEQEEFRGGGVGTFVDNGPTMMAGVGGPTMGGGGGTFGGMSGNGGDRMEMMGGTDGMTNGGNEQERYSEYLEMINRKYGIGMPGNGNGGRGGQMPTMPNNFIGNNQIAGNQQQQMGQQIVALPPPTQIPFGSPPWGISPTAGGQPNGAQSQNNIGIQQMCRQMANTIGQSNGQQQQKAMPFECITNIGGTGGGGGKENGEQQKQQVEKQVEAVAAAILAAGDHQKQQLEHGDEYQTIGSSGNSIVGSVVHSAGHQHYSTIAPSGLEPPSSTGTIGGEGGEETTNGELATQKPTGLYGSAMLGRLIGSSLANSMNSGLNPSSSSHSSTQSLHSYALSGARVPFPFGTVKTRKGIGVDGGPWLLPAPSVASLIKSNKMPGQYGGEQIPAETHQHQQQRSIEANQQQLLLSLLSTQRPMMILPTSSPVEIRSTPMTTTAIPPVNSDTMESAAETAAPTPMQPSTTSIQALTQQIRRLPAVLYANSQVASSQKLETLLREVYGLPLVTFYVDRIDGPKVVERNLEQLTAHKGLPYLFICGTFIGSTEHVQNYHEQRQVPKLVEYVCNGEVEKRGKPTNRQQMDEPQPQLTESNKKIRSKKGRQKKAGSGRKGRKRQTSKMGSRREHRNGHQAESERKKSKGNGRTIRKEKSQLSQGIKETMHKRH